MVNALRRIIMPVCLCCALTLLAGVQSFAADEAILIDSAAIEAEIVAAVNAGQDPATAAKDAVANVVDKVMQANPDYPGGTQALMTAVLTELVNVKVPGLTTVETQIAGSRSFIAAEIAAAVANGADPKVAAKSAVANVVKTIMAIDADYSGGQEALALDILDALAGETIAGLDVADILVAGNHALGNTVDTEIEAYESPNTGTQQATQARQRIQNTSGNTYGPGGKPSNGSPT